MNYVRRPVKASDIEQMKEMRKAGATYEDIADALDRNVCVIRYHLNDELKARRAASKAKWRTSSEQQKAYRERLKQVSDRKTTFVTMKEIRGYEALFQQGYSKNYIASVYGRDPGTVYKYLKDIG